MELRNRTKEQGFTLIEIIAVLIILGILAAVAVPKFIDLQNEAKVKSALQGVSAAQSQIAMNYASNLLSLDGNTVSAWTATVGNATIGNDNCGVNTEDYRIECEEDTANNEITIIAWTSADDGATAEDVTLNATGAFHNPAVD